MTASQARELARRTLSDERYQHTLNVEKAAVEIAAVYGVPQERARVAALLHDICKERSRDDLLQMLRGSAIIDENHAQAYGPVLHAFAGGVYVRRELGLDDELADAVCYHTTGRPGMSALEKTVFLADCISEERQFRNLDELRALAKTDPDEACLLSLRNSMVHVVKQLKTLVPLTCEAYNWFVETRGKQNG